MDADSILRDSVPGLPSNILSGTEDGSNISINYEKFGQQVHSHEAEEPRPISGTAHVAFLVDANTTSYLMMGSLSPGLKSHAVTLYEAGKLGHSCISELCKDLDSLEGKGFEGELQEFADHAFGLRCVLECLKSGGVAGNGAIVKAGVEISAEHSLLDDATSLVTEIKIIEGSSIPDVNETNAVDDEVPQLSHSCGESESIDGSFESFLTTSEIKAPAYDNDLENDQNVALLDAASGEKGILKTKRKYRVDVLRCESLAALAPATLERLFLRDYDIIISMAPLPPPSILPRSLGPLHFGLPSYSSMAPWMKVVLYITRICGPLQSFL